MIVIDSEYLNPSEEAKYLCDIRLRNVTFNSAKANSNIEF